MFKRCSKQLKQVIFLTIFLGCAILNYLIFVSSQSLNGINSLVNEVTNNLWLMSRAYSNPIIMLQTVAFVLFFETLQIHSKIINNLAKPTLGIYLIHDNPLVRGVIYQWLKIDNGLVSNYSFIVYIFIIAIAIYIICSLIEWIRQQLFLWIYNRKISINIRNKYYNWFSNLCRIDIRES